MSSCFGVKKEMLNCRRRSVWGLLCLEELVSSTGGAAWWGHPRGAALWAVGWGCHPDLAVCVILCLWASCMCLGVSHTFILIPSWCYYILLCLPLLINEVIPLQSRSLPLPSTELKTVAKSCIEWYFMLESHWNDSGTHFGAYPSGEDFIHAMLWEMSVHLFICLIGFLCEWALLMLLYHELCWLAIEIFPERVNIYFWTRSSRPDTSWTVGMTWEAVAASDGVGITVTITQLSYYQILQLPELLISLLGFL